MDLSDLIASRAVSSHDAYARAINPQFVKVLRTIGFDRPWVRASGAHLYDADGNRYLDLLGGFGMFNVGRNNPRVRQALAQALELEPPNAVQLGVSPLPGVLAEALIARAPAGIGKVLFTSSGTEAVEAAVKLGRAASGRTRVLSADHGFHGLTLGSLSLNGNAEFRERFEPLLPGFDRVPWNDLDALERELVREDVGLVVLEPIQGKGCNLPAPGYLEGVQALCRRYGTLLCLDEVQTGLGRTGRFLALEHWGLEPDLITISKSLSGGIVPSGALLMRDAVYETVFDSLENALSHGSTFAPNDFAMVAGLATLEELDARRLVDHAARLGEELLTRTRPLVDEHEVVHDVRGLGLMWAIEFAEPDRGSRAFRLIEKMQKGLFAQVVIGPLFRDHRILSQVAGHNMNVIKILPPLVLDRDDLDWFLGALDQVLDRSRGIPRELVGMALRAARAR
ncbi:MAG: aspartate aminotransferase family protein [Actinobacteria bacterium]|nr:aspartate aminotransferase family protein [Actinomycetota bacterium]